MAHGHDERVNGAPIAQVTDKIDVEIIKRTLGLVDGVDVEQTLRGVHVGAVDNVLSQFAAQLWQLVYAQFAEIGWRVYFAQ